MNTSSEKAKKRWGLIMIMLTISIAILAGIMIFKAQKFNKYMDSLVITDIDLTNVDDGSYIGKENAGIINVKVSVDVKENRIINLEILKHTNGQGDEANRIVDDIKSNQTLMVDDITGATLSSIVIKKAVENALSEN